MSPNSLFTRSVLPTAFALSLATFAMAQARNAAPATALASKAQAAIEQAAKDGKYTFLMFYKTNDAASNAMSATLKEALAEKSEKAVVAYVQVGNSAEQALVTKYDVSRAPMPMTIAPNGAMTDMFAQRVTAEKLGDAFVTPPMMFAMKNLQENKLVLVTVQGAAKAPAPVAIKDFQSDPHFKDRIVTIGMTAADPQEGKFVGQMQIDPKAKATHTVLLAPPGVMVGKFDAVTSKDEIAAALAKAGKCCDDPNCKHHQTPSRTATQPQRRGGNFGMPGIHPRFPFARIRFLFWGIRSALETNQSGSAANQSGDESPHSKIQEETMNLKTLVWRELAERPSVMLTSTLTILLGVTALVAIRHVTVFSEREVGQQLQSLGANVLVLPKDVTLQDCYSADLTERIGFVFQTFNLVPYLTALENVEVPLLLHGVSKSEQRDRAVALLEQVGLGNRIEHKPSELSTGQQQRVALARTLANNPRLILADEPTGNLDPDCREAVLSMFDNFVREGRTIVMVTHDSGAAARASRRLCLNDGTLVTPQEIPAAKAA